MKDSDNKIALLYLIRAGLWEKDVQLSFYRKIDWAAVYRLASEQAILGLILAGLEHSDVKPPQALLLQLIGEVQTMERRNIAMNDFVSKVFGMLRENSVKALLMKGQGIAQCYERPLWRSSGDIDILVNESDFVVTRELLRPFTANGFLPDVDTHRHISTTISLWEVELHANQETGISTRIDKILRSVQIDTFLNNGYRNWPNGDTAVMLPNPNNDVLFVFTHFLKHFYKGGLGLRQICDWCRLLWTYKESINVGLLQGHLKEMKLVDEWKAFGMFAVEKLGMPSDAMPLYSNERKWSRKADKILDFVMEVGNFGHNRDNSYRRYPFLVRKAASFFRRCGDLFKHMAIFPMASFRYFPSIVFNGLKSAAKGVG